MIGSHQKGFDDMEAQRRLQRRLKAVLLPKDQDGEVKGGEDTDGEDKDGKLREGMSVHRATFEIEMSAESRSVYVGFNHTLPSRYVTGAADALVNDDVLDGIAQQHGKRSGRRTKGEIVYVPLSERHRDYILALNGDSTIGSSATHSRAAPADCAFLTLDTARGDVGLHVPLVWRDGLLELAWSDEEQRAAREFVGRLQSEDEMPTPVGDFYRILRAARQGVSKSHLRKAACADVCNSGGLRSRGTSSQSRWQLKNAQDAHQLVCALAAHGAFRSHLRCWQSS